MDWIGERKVEESRIEWCKVDCRRVLWIVWLKLIYIIQRSQNIPAPITNPWDNNFSLYLVQLGCFFYPTIKAML